MSARPSSSASAPLAVTPLAPLASATSVSFVDSEPSTDTRLSDASAARRSNSASTAGSTIASVVAVTMVVATSGRIIPAPLPITPMRTSPPLSAQVTMLVLAHASVVRIASAAAAPPVPESSPAACAMPRSTASIGRGLPITPVEQTTTSPAEMPSACAVAAAMARASCMPRAPVQAFALPELTTIARARPSARCSRESTTGAAARRLRVKAPAALALPSQATRARSGAPEALIPQVTPAARKPRGKQTPTPSLTRPAREP